MNFAKLLLLAFILTHLVASSESLLEAALTGEEVLGLDPLMLHSLQIDDSFYSACIAKLEAPGFTEPSARRNLWKTCFRAAALNVRIDVAERLIEAEPQYCWHWINKWIQAQQLLATGQLDEAYRHFDQLRADFYRPNLCCYLLSQIELVRGKHQQSQNFLLLARFYEARSRRDSGNTFQPRDLDLFETPAR